MTDSNFTNAEAQAYADDNNISLEEAQNFLSGGSTETEINIGGVFSSSALTEEDIRKIVRDEVDKYDKYYRRTYPTFEITGGGPTLEHGESEYCLTTESSQGLHFYQGDGGIGKLGANKTIEIQAGHVSPGNGKGLGGGGNAIKLQCKNGRILIFAESSDIELNARNIGITATNDIILDAGGNIKGKSGANTEFIAFNDISLDATKQLFINGGDAVGIHCEGDMIHTTSGIDETFAPDFYDGFSAFHEAVPPLQSKITFYNQNK